MLISTTPHKNTLLRTLQLFIFTPVYTSAIITPRRAVKSSKITRMSGFNRCEYLGYILLMKAVSHYNSRLENMRMVLKTITIHALFRERTGIRSKHPVLLGIDAVKYPCNIPPSPSAIATHAQLTMRWVVDSVGINKQEKLRKN